MTEWGGLSPMIYSYLRELKRAYAAGSLAPAGPSGMSGGAFSPSAGRRDRAHADAALRPPRSESRARDSRIDASACTVVVAGISHERHRRPCPGPARFHRDTPGEISPGRPRRTRRDPRALRARAPALGAGEAPGAGARTGGHG